MQQNTPHPAGLAAFLTLSLFLSLILASSLAAQDSTPEGIYSLHLSEVDFGFPEKDLEIGLCNDSDSGEPDPISFFLLPTPPEFVKPIIRTHGSGGDSKPMLLSGPYFVGQLGSGIAAPLTAQQLCGQGSTEIQLSCGSFNYSFQLDGDQHPGAVIFETDGDPTSSMHGGSFSAAVPVRLRFDFTDAAGTRQGHGFGEVTWLMTGSWSSQGIDDSTIPGQGVLIDSDCDQEVEEVLPAAAVYLGAQATSEGPQPSPFCGADALGWSEFCIQPVGSL